MKNLGFTRICRKIADVAIYAHYPESFCSENLASGKILLFLTLAEGMDFPIPPESWWSTDILSSLPGKALIGFHHYLMKTNENQWLLIKTFEQWKPTNTNEWNICIWWHLCIWVFCIYLFLYFCAGFLFVFYLFVIIIIFFSSSTLLFMRTKEREIRSCFWFEFIMMMVISVWQNVRSV